VPNPKLVFWVSRVVVKLINKVYGSVFGTRENSMGFHGLVLGAS
jgi:hypothetical protein